MANTATPRILIAIVWGCLFGMTCGAIQNAEYRIVYDTREYKAVGKSIPVSMAMTLPDRVAAPYARNGCTAQEIRSETLPPDVSLPGSGEHWDPQPNLTRALTSPDGKLLLVGAIGGSSTSHFYNYWLLDRATRKWTYAGAGNDAKWSPDSARILWSTARELAPIGKVQVWVSHLVLFDVKTMKEQILTSGVSQETNFHWCTTGKGAIREFEERFAQAAPVKAANLTGTWVMIRHVMTEKFINGVTGPDHVLYDPAGIRGQDRTGNLEWVLTFEKGASAQPEVTAVKNNAAGEATFDKDYGGDSEWNYRCRLAARDDLLCLLTGHPGHGVEFRLTTRE